MKNNSMKALLSKISAPLVVVGIVCLGLLVVSVCMFILGSLGILIDGGDIEEIFEYMLLTGRYSNAANFLFLYNHFLFLIGCLGVPFLATGAIAHYIGNKE